MLCRATERRFYNGVMVGPDTGNPTVFFVDEDKHGNKIKRPVDFEPIPEAEVTAEDKSNAELINNSQVLADSKVKAEINPVLPESGGGQAPTAAKESITSAQAAEAIRNKTAHDPADSDKVTLENDARKLGIELDRRMSLENMTLDFDKQKAAKGAVPQTAASELKSAAVVASIADDKAQHEANVANPVNDGAVNQGSAIDEAKKTIETADESKDSQGNEKVELDEEGKVVGHDPEIES